MSNSSPAPILTLSATGTVRKNADPGAGLPQGRAMSEYTSIAEHKFTFGLWAAGRGGRALFGAPVRHAEGCPSADEGPALRRSNTT